MNDERVSREKSFHDKLFSLKNNVRSDLEHYYDLMVDANIEYHGLVGDFEKGYKILEYGCGTGTNTLLWASKGKDITGIDISSSGIQSATDDAVAKKMHCKFYQMNAENLQFEDGAYDVIIGKGILHHLDLAKALPEISRVLKSHGEAVFIEPLGHNPFINLFRKLTPKLRTDDERPLHLEELRMFNEHFRSVTLSFYNFLTLFALPLRSTVLYRPAKRILKYLDFLIFSVAPSLKKYSWMVLIHAENPIK